MHIRIYIHVLKTIRIYIRIYNTHVYVYMPYVYAYMHTKIFYIHVYMPYATFDGLPRMNQAFRVPASLPCCYCC